MVTLAKLGDSAVKFTFTDSDHYLTGSGEIEVPVNSLLLVLDESDMVTFKKVDGDPFISFLAENSNLGSKSAIETFYKENMVGATGGGGSGSGVTSGQVESMISEALEDYPTNDDVDETLDDYYDKDEVDAGFSSVTSSVTAVNASLTAHTADTTIHTTAQEKAAWNAKVDATQVETQIETYFAPKEEVIATSLNDLNDRMDDKAEATAVTAEISAAVSGKADTSAVTAINASLTAHTADTGIHTTTEEKAAWNAKQTALTAGTGIDITNNVISVTASTGGSNVVELTQAQYEALVDKDPDVLYVITDAPEINISGKADTSAVTVVSDALTAHTANTTVHTTSAEKTTWNGKQDALVSGTNIKTINNQSLLGSGNIDIQGGGGGGISSAQCQTMIEDYCDPKEEVIATALNDLNDRVEDLESGGSSVTIATAITSSSTNDEAAGALATYNAITAATTGGGATYSAGTNISIDTANTINCTLNLANGNAVRSIKNDTASTISTDAQKGAAFGVSLEIINYGEVAVGNVNKKSKQNNGFGATGNTEFTVGNGFLSYRHNAFEVRQNGDIYFPDTDNTTYANYYEKPMVRLQDMYGALGGLKLVKLSQSEYDNLPTKDSSTLYIISNVVS